MLLFDDALALVLLVFVESLICIMKDFFNTDGRRTCEGVNAEAYVDVVWFATGIIKLFG